VTADYRQYPINLRSFVCYLRQFFCPKSNLKAAQHARLHCFPPLLFSPFLCAQVRILLLSSFFMSIFSPTVVFALCTLFYTACAATAEQWRSRSIYQSVHFLGLRNPYLTFAFYWQANHWPLCPPQRKWPHCLRSREAIILWRYMEHVCLFLLSYFCKFNHPSSLKQYPWEPRLHTECWLHS